MESSSKRSVISVFIFFLLMLSAWLVYSVIGSTKALLTRNWPTTKGMVISSDVGKVNSSKGAAKFKPVVNYIYFINEEEFTSNKFSSTPARGSSQWAAQIISQYPANKEINVHYNPKNHKESVLATGMQYDNYWMLTLSSFFFTVVLLTFIKQIKQKTK